MSVIESYCVGMVLIKCQKSVIHSYSSGLRLKEWQKSVKWELQFWYEISSVSNECDRNSSGMRLIQCQMTVTVLVRA